VLYNLVNLVEPTSERNTIGTGGTTTVPTSSQLNTDQRHTHFNRLES